MTDTDPKRVINAEDDEWIIPPGTVADDPLPADRIARFISGPGDFIFAPKELTAEEDQQAYENLIRDEDRRLPSAPDTKDSTGRGQK